MVKKQASDIRVPVALGSGLAATLLLVSLRQGTFPALFLASLSPLPLMIATLGFGHATGLGAVAVAVLTFVALMTAAAAPQNGWLDAILTAGLGGLIFAVCQALPSWWLAHLAGLSRERCGVALDRAAQRERQGMGLLSARPHRPPCGADRLRDRGLCDARGQSRPDEFRSEPRQGCDKDRAADRSRRSALTSCPNGIDIAQLARLVVRAIPPVAASMIFVSAPAQSLARRPHRPTVEPADAALARYRP